MKKSGVILFDPGERKILLVQGKKFINDYTGFIFPHGILSFPKGHLLDGESYSKCALRELKEETDINIKINRCDLCIKLADGIYFVKIVNLKNIKFKINNRNEVTRITWRFIDDLKNSFTCNRAVREFVKNYDNCIKNLIF